MDKENKSKAPKKQPSRFSYWWKWPLIVLVVAFCVSLLFGVASEYALSGAGLAISIVVIVVFIIIAIITDIIGVAVTAADIEPFRAMASKKVRGAKEAIKMVQNADRVASVSADIIGDICSILSGAAGATVTAMFILNAQNQFEAVLIASLVSAIIASLTIFGKALGKKYAMRKSEKIVLILGKIASIFHPQKSSKKNGKAIKEEKEVEKNENLQEKGEKEDE